MNTAEIFSLDGQVALITGGSRGLGLAMAHALGAAGAKLIITARKQAELDAACEQLEHAGYSAHAIRHDIGEATQAGPLVGAALDAHGRIDVLVNNAGATWGAPAEVHPWEAWQKVYNVNVHGTWALTQAVAVRAMIPRRRGAIVMVASIAGLGGNAPGEIPTVAYNSSKAAQIGLTRSLAAEWGRYGIRVNALLPGVFPSKMSASLIEQQGAQYIARAPLGRLGDARADLSGPIVFLASEASRFITGAALAVDGGFSTLR